MRRWLLWTPIAALTVATAVLGLRAGWHVSALSESDVINLAVQDYLNGANNRQATDCAAKPSSQSGVWLVVTCKPTDGPSKNYQANRYGKIHLGLAPLSAPET